MFKIEVIIRVVNTHGDVVDTRGIPAMHPSVHTARHVYPDSFQCAGDAHSEVSQVSAAMAKRVGEEVSAN